MARAPLLRKLQRGLAVVAEAERRDVPAEQVLAEKTRRRRSRREFLAAAGATAAALAARPRWLLAANAQTSRIVIVGAGLAGMTAAHELWKKGYAATVYEARDRIGGRTSTLRNFFADGQAAEHGGELIDTDHTELINLATRELGLTLVDIRAAEPPGTDETLYFDGAIYPHAQLLDDWKPVYHRLNQDLTRVPWPTTYKNVTPERLSFDNMSLAEWIDTRVDGGRASRLGQLLDVAYNIEFGLETTVQSSLNLIYMLGYCATPSQFLIFGCSDERFHLKEGSDAVCTAIQARLPAGTVVLNSVLQAVRQNTDGSYRCTFQQGPKSVDVVADRVIMTIPFSVLRRVDTNQLLLSDVKRRAITELGYGTNSKLHVQFTRRVWNAQGSTGETFSDQGYQNTWDESRGQPGESGLLIDYTGGIIGEGFNQGSTKQRVKAFLDQIEPVFPGISAAHNGKAFRDYWSDDPYSLGSYSAYKVGQYTSFGAAEGEREGKVHFCGEHTTQDWQGWMQGAVFTGLRAANEILADFKAGIFP